MGLYEKLLAMQSPQPQQMPSPLPTPSPLPSAPTQRNVRPTRPGKFPDPSTTFFKRGEPLGSDDYQACYIVNPQPGWIIHVHDSTDSRVDQGIFVVLRGLKDSGYQCLAVCVHGNWQPDHWHVALGDGDWVEVVSQEMMLIKLNEPERGLRPRITVNLTSPWRLEIDTNIAVLGRVCRASWDAILAENIKLHAEAGEALMSQGARKARVKVVTEPVKPSIEVSEHPISPVSPGTSGLEHRHDPPNNKRRSPRPYGSDVLLVTPEPKGKESRKRRAWERPHRG